MDKGRRLTIFWLCLEAISSPIFSEEWRADVVEKLDTLIGSCVVVPCTFTYPGEKLPSSKLRGIWHFLNDRMKNIYHPDNLNVMENFRGRTELVGRLGDGNCTLKMVDVKDHDNGPFCFRVEIPEKDKFSYVEHCARLTILPHPPKPTLTFSKKVIQGHPYSAVCSVIHTCPSHMPTITWSKSSSDEPLEAHKYHGSGNWETQSILTFIPEESDDHSEIICTVRFYGGMNSSQTFQLFVKRKENYLHIIIPVVVGITTAAIFGILCALVVKKYKTRIAELQRGNGSTWNRLSRLSRR
ncbi:myelin-associated glycoprotein-like [Lampris incognitus]|uniref:myelin-associated glycoprotein-like n=1 Tax=Lampris incognitus TaxID=2546036 RepID=UPI0024B5E615|nr:myelin-associated glycoprotein-like [Lampris incognitus]